jgi:hypothetical protein
VSFSNVRVTVPDRVVARAVDDLLVLLDLETGRSFTLDAVGSRVWTLLTSTPSVQATYDTLLAEYRVEGDQLGRDLQALLDELRARDLVETHPA